MKRNLQRTAALLLALCLLLPGAGLALRAHSATGDARRDMLETAAAEAGYTEEANGYTKYGDYYGDPLGAWDCAFLSWCAAHANVSITVLPRTLSRHELQSRFQTMGRYYASASQGGSYEPQPGDLAFFSANCAPFDLTGVGLVTEAGAESLTLIAGDRDGAVAQETYEPTDRRLVGYAAPAYETADLYAVGRYITNSVMNFRSGPSISAEPIDSIPVNTRLYVTEVRGIWGQTTYGGKTGWVNLEYSSFIPEEQQPDVNWLVIDICQWNPESDLNWSKMHEDGIEGVILRVAGRGYGAAKSLYLDTEFAAHYRSAKAAGLHVGAYFFSYALSAVAAREEAELTVSELRKYNCELDMPVFIDIEDIDPRNQHYHAGRAACSTVVNTFCDTVRDAGYYPGIYCSKWFAEDMLYESVFEDRAVWIAQYETRACTYGGRFDMWQYTETGRISAYRGKIDLNRCYTNFPAMINGTPQQPEPPAEDPPDDPPAELGAHTPEAGWTIARAATCAAEGERLRRCADCGVLLQTETIPRTEHTSSCDYVFIGDTAWQAGSTLTGQVLKRLHAETEPNYDILYLATYRLKGGTLLRYCTVCKKILYAEYSFPECEHEKLSVQTEPAACDAPGVRRTVCGVCGETVKTEMLPFAAHEPEENVLTFADCTLGGMRSTRCTLCGVTIASVYEPARAHTFEEHAVLQRPTIYTAGMCEDRCAVCGVTAERPLARLDLGDVNADGRLTAADARTALRYAVELERPEDEICRETADVNHDGRIGADDARYILRMAVSLDEPDALFLRFYESDGGEEERGKTDAPDAQPEEETLPGETQEPEEETPPEEDPGPEEHKTEIPVPFEPETDLPEPREPAEPTGPAGPQPETGTENTIQGEEA